MTTTPEPQRLEAAPEDIKIAEQAKPVEEVPPPAPAAEVDELRNLVLTREVKTRRRRSEWQRTPKRL